MCKSIKRYSIFSVLSFLFGLIFLIAVILPNFIHATSFLILLSAIFWIVGFFPYLAILSGIVALIFIKKTGLKGKLFAISGIILGSLGIIYILITLLTIFKVLNP